MIIQYGLEPVLIQCILISFQAILEKKIFNFKYEFDFPTKLHLEISDLYVRKVLSTLEKEFQYETFLICAATIVQTKLLLYVSMSDMLKNCFFCKCLQN